MTIVKRSDITSQEPMIVELVPGDQVSNTDSLVSSSPWEQEEWHDVPTGEGQTVKTADAQQRAPPGIAMTAVPSGSQPHQAAPQPMAPHVALHEAPDAQEQAEIARLQAAARMKVEAAERAAAAAAAELAEAERAAAAAAAAAELAEAERAAAAQRAAAAERADAARAAVAAAAEAERDRERSAAVAAAARRAAADEAAAAAAATAAAAGSQGRQQGQTADGPQWQTAAPQPKAPETAATEPAGQQGGRTAGGSRDGQSVTTVVKLGHFGSKTSREQLMLYARLESQKQAGIKQTSNACQGQGHPQGMGPAAPHSSAHYTGPFDV
jgi:hypothetical protein